MQNTTLYTVLGKIDGEIKFQDKNLTLTELETYMDKMQSKLPTHGWTVVAQSQHETYATKDGKTLHVYAIYA